MITFISLALTALAHAYSPSPSLLGSPALLVDYSGYSAEAERFHRPGSQTRALRDLVEILYDWDNNRPWGPAYFPEANARLKAFREIVCGAFPSALPAPTACFRPAILLGRDEIKTLQAALLDPVSISALREHLQLEISSWVLPFRENGFSLQIGASGGASVYRASFWGNKAESVDWASLRVAHVSDKDTYRAGFEQKDFPALMSYGQGGMILNDWLLRHRTMAFAASWHHAVGANRRWNPANPVVEAKERLFQSLFETHQEELLQLYGELHGKVQGEHRARFEKSRGEGSQPEEVFQHLSYRYLRELLQLQGSYFFLARKAGNSISPRQQALESLLTVQRYHSAPRFLSMELLTLIEPLTSHAFVLDAAADASLAQAFLMEQLKALLGMDNYQGSALFPALGAGLLHAELFRESYLDEYAPDIKKELGGRDFLALNAAEQIRILSLYLAPAPGKFRPQALYRMSALWLGTATDAELRKLADVVHAKRYP